MTTDTLQLVLQQLIDGQERMESRLTAIETTLAEHRGERRARNWMAHSITGFITAAITTFVNRWVAKH